MSILSGKQKIYQKYVIPKFKFHNFSHNLLFYEFIVVRVFISKARNNKTNHIFLIHIFLQEMK